MERIYVVVRPRPLPPDDSKASPWSISANSIFLANHSTKFEFDRVFGEDCKTVDVYAARTKAIVDSIVSGFNGTVFAYGQTSSGKTHTMRGSVNEAGIIPLSVHDLFCSIEKEVGREFLVRMSYMEIYNEEINDLLAPEHRKLQIHESLERGIYVAGLREEIVTSPEQVLELLEFGESHRHFGQTNMNIYSSRSHTIFRMIVESRERSEGNSINSCDSVRVSILNLVDLAGSERLTKTGAEGMRLKEGSHINKSLMTLGTVIKKLSDGAESQGGHVPYRDSKLTRILQPSLGGNANTAMICNVSLLQIHADETKSSLQFASRALQVKNCACVNEILTDAALLKRQRKEIEELRAKLLSSHSEHLEEEILNLRNTLLQSELEKERIALELEEEKKAKALRERRLWEQAKKIEDLSSLILYSERDERNCNSIKTTRRVTWCPGPIQEKSNNEEPYLRAIKEEPESLLLAFSDLMKESNGPTNTLRFGGLPENAISSDMKDGISLPDAHALLNVTSRRKVQKKRAVPFLEGDQTVEIQNDAEISKDEVLRNKSKELESCPANQSNASFLCHLMDNAPDRYRNLIKEPGDIHLVKQHQEEIQLQMERTSPHLNLNKLVAFESEHNSSTREMRDEEICGGSGVNLSIEIRDISSVIDYIVDAFDKVSRTTEEFCQHLTILSDVLLGFKILPKQCMAHLESIISGHRRICSYMAKKIEEVEFEKNLLSSQLCSHQKEILELKSLNENLDKIIADQCLQNDVEKDELLSQVLYLHNEVSILSSSSLAKEKEVLRKELEKIKSKLKDTEYKLKNTIQDKVKLEGEKAQAEREIKSLQGQRAILDRDILKRDSLFDRRRESRPDCNKNKAFNALAQQNLQINAFELESKIASLEEALEAVVGEKEEALVRNGILDSELEAMANKLTSAYSEMELLREEIAQMGQRLADSECCCKRLEDSLDLLSREKEEMALQLTDALLETEVEKYSWVSREKTLCEKLKVSDDEIMKLSAKLLKAINEMEFFKGQCIDLKERLTLFEESAKTEKESRMVNSSEISPVRKELERVRVDAGGNEDVRLNSVSLSEFQHRCMEEERQSTIVRTTRETDSLVSIEELRRLNVEIEDLERKYDVLLSNVEPCFREMSKRISNIEFKLKEVASVSSEEINDLTMKLCSAKTKLEVYRGRSREAVDEMKLMDAKYQEASSKLKKQLSQYARHILDLKKQLAEKE